MSSAPSFQLPASSSQLPAPSYNSRLLSSQLPSFQHIAPSSQLSQFQALPAPSSPIPNSQRPAPTRCQLPAFPTACSQPALGSQLPVSSSLLPTPISSPHSNLQFPATNFHPPASHFHLLALTSQSQLPLAKSKFDFHNAYSFQFPTCSFWREFSASLRVLKLKNLLCVFTSVLSGSGGHKNQAKEKK